MRKTVTLPIAAALCLMLAPTWAFAQVPPPPPSGPAPGPGPEPEKDPEPTPDPEPEMSEEEKLEKAKGLYLKAEGQFAEEDYIASTKNYEAAYYLVPAKHGFAHKVGVSAFKAGDCNKSEEYLQHFLRYNGDPDKYADKVDEAKIILGEISASGCATKEAAKPTGPAEQATEEDAPELTSRRSERNAANADAARERDKSTIGPLMATGIALTAIGGAALITGGITWGLAASNASQLNDLSSNNTNSGFPGGDYSDSSVFQMDRQLDTYNTLTITGFAVGGVLAGTGIALIVVDAMRKKKLGGGDSAGADAAPETAHVEALGPAFFPGGGGAAASVRF